MDDDLDFSNNDLLAQIQAAKQQINERLDEIRKCLQSTVDHVSTLEHRMELDKAQLASEFDQTEKEIVDILRARKAELLAQLDQEVTESRSGLLKRCEEYQQNIMAAADLQTELLRFETSELTMNPHLDTTTSEEKSGEPSHQDESSGNGSGESGGNDLNGDYVDITEDVLHSDGPSQEDSDKNQMSNRAKQRLMEEVAMFLSSKIPEALEPSVWFISHREPFLTEFAKRTEKFCAINFSAGSQIQDIQRTLASGISWVSARVPNLFSWGNNGADNVTELKSIPPPLLVIRFDVSRELSEQFVENFTVINKDVLPPGCVFPIVDCTDFAKIKRWLSSSVDDFVDEDDQQFRPYLRLCIFLYDPAVRSVPFINQTTREYFSQYNLRNILTIEIRSASSEESSTFPDHSCGTLLHEDGRMLDDQDEVFSKAATIAFSPSTSTE